MHNVVVSVQAGGETGHGYTFCFAEHEARAVLELVLGLAPPLLGSEADAVRTSWRRMWEATNFIGHSGPGVMALAAIDTALWDARARARTGRRWRTCSGARPPRAAPMPPAAPLDLDLDGLLAEGRAIRDAGYSGVQGPRRRPRPGRRRRAPGGAARGARRVPADGRCQPGLGPRHRGPRGEGAGAATASSGWRSRSTLRTSPAPPALRAREAVPIAAGETAWGTGGQPCACSRPTRSTSCSRT